MAGKSTIELNHERSVDQILRSTLELYRGFPALFLILAAAVMVPYDLAVLGATGHGPFGLVDDSFAVRQLLNILGFSLVGPLISALHAHALVMIGQGGRPRLATVALNGLRVLPVVSAAEILANLGILLGFIALIIPGILLALRWSVVAQVAAIEHDGWFPALRRSGQLTANHYVHIFGLLLLTGAIAAAARFGIGAISPGSTSSVPSVALGIAVDTILASFTALAFAILYFDLLARQTAPGAPRASAPREYRHLADLD